MREPPASFGSIERPKRVATVFIVAGALLAEAGLRGIGITGIALVLLAGWVLLPYVAMILLLFGGTARSRSGAAIVACLFVAPFHADLAFQTRVYMSEVPESLFVPLASEIAEPFLILPAYQVCVYVGLLGAWRLGEWATNRFSAEGRCPFCGARLETVHSKCPRCP